MARKPRKSPARKSPASKAAIPAVEESSVLVLEKVDHTNQIRALQREWTNSKNGADRLAINTRIRALKAEMAKY